MVASVSYTKMKTNMKTIGFQTFLEAKIKCKTKHS